MWLDGVYEKNTNAPTVKPQTMSFVNGNGINQSYITASHVKNTFQLIPYGLTGKQS